MSLIRAAAEKVRIQTLDLVDCLSGNAQIVLNHQSCQHLAVYQDDFCGVLLLGISTGLFGKLRGCNKQAFAGSLPGQGPYKFLNLRTYDGFVPIPALCLDVNYIKAQLVLPDDPVDPLVTALSHNRPGAGKGAAVTHALQQFHNKTLKKRGRLP